MRDFVLQVKLTNRCDLKCARCYNLGPDARNSEELATDSWKAILTAASAHFASRNVSLHVHFIGGEPLLRGDLFELSGVVSCASRANATLVTNGYALKENDMPRIAESFHAVTVNMPALDPKGFARIRGADCFEGIVENVKRLVERRIPVALAMNVSRHNVGEVGRIIGLAEELGVGRVAFHRFIGTTRLDDWHLTPQLLREAVGKIKTAWVAHPKVNVVTRDPVLAVALGLELKPCIAGASMLNIEPDGTVTPCRYIADAVGDAAKESLADILNGPRARRYADIASGRDRCADCTSRDRCRGCRALAIHNGDAAGEDPLCRAVLGGGGA
jgi:radical SAM protein with 4Fe4S-binding SPASM domain